MSDQKLVQIDKQKVFEALGIGDFSEEQQDAIFDMFEKNVNLKVAMYLASILNDEEIKKLQSFENSDDAFTYLAEKEINIEELALKATLEVREDMIEDIAYIRGMIDAKNSEQDAA